MQLISFSAASPLYNLWQLIVQALGKENVRFDDFKPSDGDFENEKGTCFSHILLKHVRFYEYLWREKIIKMCIIVESTFCRKE